MGEGDMSLSFVLLSKLQSSGTPILLSIEYRSTFYAPSSVGINSSDPDEQTPRVFPTERFSQINGLYWNRFIKLNSRGQLKSQWLFAFVTARICLQDNNSLLVEGICQIPDPLYKLVGSIICFYIPLGVMLLTYTLTVRLLAYQQRRLGGRPDWSTSWLQQKGIAPTNI